MFEEEVKSLIKEGLVEKVVRRIKNLLSELCKSCNKNSSFQLSDFTKLHCLCCSRGACRDCYEVDIPVYNKLPMRGSGLYYFCNTCSFQVEKQVKMPEMKKAQKRPKKKMVVLEPAFQADIFEEEDADEEEEEEEEQD